MKPDVRVQQQPWGLTALISARWGPGLWAGPKLGRCARALRGGAVAGVDRRACRQSLHQSLHSGPGVHVGTQASEDGLLLLGAASRS